MTPAQFCAHFNACPDDDDENEEAGDLPVNA